MRLYIQQLEERIRQLTGENERLAYELNQLRVAARPAAACRPRPMQTGAVADRLRRSQTRRRASRREPRRPARRRRISARCPSSPNDPLIAPDGACRRTRRSTFRPCRRRRRRARRPGADARGRSRRPPILRPQTAGTACRAAAPTTALSGSPRDEYDLAYGYILTGDYGLAEESFKTWLAAFPSDPQAADAQFWLGESHLQQGEYRDAANAFLAVYKTAPDSTKGPDALLKLGVSLSALGEKTRRLRHLRRARPPLSAGVRVADEPRP